MKNFTFPIVVLLFSVIFICSCSGKTDRSRKPVSTIELISSPKKLVLGQSLTVKISTRLKNGKLKRVQVFLNNKLMTISEQAVFSFNIPLLAETGINTIRVMAEKTDGIFNTRSQNFTVFSDIVPVKYTYSVIREFKHSADHFTQGLQIVDGFLYEGTGENGKSALFKINLANSNVLMTKPLSEKFFGEGITVLHDKIYQLTYKHQIGFVYNKSDFAVIDSFKFDSQEGWGLTNDGKSLIMSNGTGTLTWLNPENYVIEKKIQATDDQKVYQNVNELEYDNGALWANIWTSDQIIRIDARSGKVLGYIDLSGILGVMATSQSEKIDVLNGIALFPQTGNLLITGKLWPKMFEIKVLNLK
jgi:glutaminyl-peptide cyclotransferase